MGGGLGRGHRPGRGDNPGRGRSQGEDDYGRNQGVTPNHATKKMEPGSRLTEAEPVDVETQAELKSPGNTEGPGGQPQLYQGGTMVMSGRGEARVLED